MTAITVRSSARIVAHTPDDLQTVIFLMTALTAGETALADTEVRRVVDDPDQAVRVIATLLGAVQWALAEIAAECGLSTAEVLAQLGLSIARCGRFER